jgi:hypothetical protein
MSFYSFFRNTEPRSWPLSVVVFLTTMPWP